MEWWNDGSKTVIQYSNIPTLPRSVTPYILRAELTSAGGEAVKFYSDNHGSVGKSQWIASWHAQKRITALPKKYA
jgi:hypothetical protein